MRAMIAWFGSCAVAVSPALFGCGEVEESEGGGDCDPLVGSNLVYEDNFDGESLDPGWVDMNEEQAPYALTGDGELEIEGEDGGDESGAGFVNSEVDPGTCYQVTAAFRTTQDDPYEDDADLLLFLNWDIDSDSGYGLVLTSDPIDGVRDYALSIYSVVDGEPIELLSESAGGDTPQITGEGSYIMEGIYCDGCIVFSFRDEDATVDKTITLEDSTHTTGGVGFDGDLNIGSGGEQSIYFDYFRVYN